MLLVGALSLPCVFAQDAPALSDTTYWKKAFRANLTVNQATFSDNWKAGGINSIAIGTLLAGRADYLKNKISFNNEAEFQYGVLNTREQGARKTADRIFADSKLGYRLSDKWNMFASMNFITQFAPGFRYERDADNNEVGIRISSFLSPGFLTFATGFEYKPVDYFFLRLSPFSPRMTFVTDRELFLNEPRNYGVEVGRTVRYEWLAFQAAADFDKNLTDNINLKMRYLMFVNYEEFAFDTIDHRFDLILTAKIAKYFSTNLNLIMLYDKDQDDKVQIGQALSIGFLYTFSK
jgi:hypothetical protein